MFEQYRSLDEIMQNGGREMIQAELNATPLYVGAVRHCRFKEIGMVVNTEKGIIAHYASHNNPEGKIEKIVDALHQPDITVRVKERVLLEILRHVDYIKAHPLSSFARYSRHFHMNASDYKRICKAVLGLACAPSAAKR